MTTTPTTDAERVRQWRARRGVTQREAAEWFGVTERAWQRYEAGDRRVPRPLLILLRRSRVPRRVDAPRG